MKTILILTHPKDDCAPLVIKHFEKNNIDYARFDTEMFPQKVKITARLDGTHVDGKITFADRIVNFNDIGAVWNRRPHKPEIDPLLTNPIAREWAEEESLYGLYCIYSLLDCPWINSKEADDKLKYNKWLQMKIASEVGLKTPASLLTNDAEEIKKFWDYVEKQMLMKKIRAGLLRWGEKNVQLLHSSKLRQEHLTDENLKRMRFAPVFLQRYIEKSIELRVIVIGTDVFACEIHSQEHQETKIDWRGRLLMKDPFLLKHTPHQMPKEVVQKLIAFMEKFNLNFSAIDMILTPDGEYVFLEDNSNGQWAWLEILTGLPISKAIADYLAKVTR